jgi:hypothetical protein
MSNVPKFEHNGCVAVLVSPDYGAGWSSWALPEEREYMLFDPDIVEILTDEKSRRTAADRVEDIALVVKIKGYQSYSGGLDQLQVVWIPVGTRFRIIERDGDEKVEMEGSVVWDIA